MLRLEQQHIETFFKMSGPLHGPLLQEGAVCCIEKSCCHQGVTDVVRHIKTKGHQEKQQALQSTATISQYTMPVPSVGGMSAQEVKV